MKIIPLYLAAELTSTDVLEPGAPPANYTKEETIAAWRTKAAQTLAEEARWIPCVGEVQRLVVLDAKGDTVFDRSRTGKLRPAMAFVNWLLSEYPASLSDLYYVSSRFGGRAPTQYGLLFVGFDVKAILKVVAMEILRHEPAQAVTVPTGLWHGVENFLDPYEAIMPAAYRSTVDRDLCLTKLGLDAPTGVLERAVVARQLTERVQLLGRD